MWSLTRIARRDLEFGDESQNGLCGEGAGGGSFDFGFVSVGLWGTM